MAEHELSMVHPGTRPARRPIVPNAVLGTLIFILTEIMLFAGLMSAFAISKAAAPMWPPPNQPRLPVEATMFNTVALLASAGLLWWAGRRFARDAKSARGPFLAAYALGAFFVAYQGYEWVGLIGEGLTLTTSNHASFFYLVVGIHAVHVVGGLGALTALLRRAYAGTLTADAFWAGRVYWFFVVGLWPILYWRVYL